MIYLPGCGICAEQHPYKGCYGKDGENTACLMLSHMASALTNLVSVVRRERGEGGILLPMEAALGTAKEMLAAYYDAQERSAAPQNIKEG